MFPIDYHVHTDWTRDATGNVADYCERAEELGIKEIAFTNHLILRRFESVPGIGKKATPKMSMQARQIPEYYKEIENARKRFKMRIRFGLEVDYFEDMETTIRKILREHPFDFILGSCHFIGNYSVADAKSSALFFPGRNVLQSYTRYFSNLKKAIESQMFDVMAHPDVIRRYAVKYKDIQFEKYKDIAVQIADALYENGTGIEVNTRGYSEFIHDSLPSMEFLKACRKAGVKTVTIGSDSHSPLNLGNGIERGIEKLKKAGYTRISLFDQRRQSEFRI